MKNYLKDKIFNSILIEMKESMPQLSEAQARRLSEKLCDITYNIYITNTNGLKDEMAKMSTTHEQNRAKFKAHIDLLQSKTNKMLASFKEKGFVGTKYDTYNKKTYLKGKTLMVDDMVDFLNVVNDSVILFYKEVYNIEETTSDVPQITLF